MELANQRAPCIQGPGLVPWLVAVNAVCNSTALAVVACSAWLAGAMGGSTSVYSYAVEMIHQEKKKIQITVLK